MSLENSISVILTHLNIIKNICTESATESPLHCVCGNVFRSAYHLNSHKNSE